MASRGGTEEEKKKNKESIQFLIKLGKVDENVISALEDVSFSEAFGWTPEEIDKQDPRRLEAYKAAMIGRSMSSRQVRRELR